MALLGYLRQSVLATLRVPAVPLAAPASFQFWRGFADASYLDKKDVTDRVISVVKNFEKVEEGKVRWWWCQGTPLQRSAGFQLCAATVGFTVPPFVTFDAQAFYTASSMHAIADVKQPYWP